MTVHILIVDDEQLIRESLSGLFEDEGYLVSTASSGEEAVARFRKRPADCIFLDIWMPGIDGLETMTRIKQVDPEVPVIMMSGHATIDTAVRATKLGAFDFIEKPFSSDKLLILLRNATDKRRLAIENSSLKLESHRDCPQLIGNSAIIAEVRSEIEKLATGEQHTLIYGEHGTGKSVVARLLHEGSKRQDGPFISVNAKTIGLTDLDYELFGYEKGTVPGSKQALRGRLEAAHQGTVYIEEIVDVPPEIQERLLKVLQERRIKRLGNPVPIACDIRLIVSTQYSLQKIDKEKLLIDGLYEKLDSSKVIMPCLRQRVEDVPELLNYFADMQSKKMGGDPVTFSEGMLEVLQEYDWPGNVRELNNYVERCHILHSGEEMTADSMLPLDSSVQRTEPVADDLGMEDGFHDARKRFESRYIEHHLEKNNWNVSKTAAEIGMERSQLHRKIKSHDLVPPQK